MLTPPVPIPAVTAVNPPLAAMLVIVWKSCDVSTVLALGPANVVVAGAPYMSVPVIVKFTPELLNADVNVMVLPKFLITVFFKFSNEAAPLLWRDAIKEGSTPGHINVTGIAIFIIP